MRFGLCFFLLTHACQAADPLVIMLRNSPEVVRVQQPVQAIPSIIHIRDWHWVPYGYVAAELPDDAPDSVIMQAHLQHLDQVREVQNEQYHLLRRPFLKEIQTLFREGLTPDVQPAFRTASRALWKHHNALPDANQLHRHPNVLSLGVPGRLVAKHNLKDVRAADTDSTLALTNPVLEDGRLRIVPRQAIETREDHMVRQIHQTGRTCIIILGGAHDLTDNVRRICRGKLGLIVVTTTAYQRHATGR